MKDGTGSRVVVDDQRYPLQLFGWLPELHSRKQRYEVPKRALLKFVPTHLEKNQDGKIVRSPDQFKTVIRIDAHPTIRLPATAQTVASDVNSTLRESTMLLNMNGTCTFRSYIVNKIYQCFEELLPYGTNLACE